MNSLEGSAPPTPHQIGHSTHQLARLDLARPRGRPDARLGPLQGPTLGVLRVLTLQAPSPALHLVQFLLPFLESTGLRSAELLDARCGHLRRHKMTWMQWTWVFVMPQ